MNITDFIKSIEEENEEKLIKYLEDGYYLNSLVKYYFNKRM
jgi:hypothetical protein